MNAYIKIFAFFFLYLYWETSAAVILEAEGAEAIDRAEAIGGVEVNIDGVEFNSDGIEVNLAGVEGESEIDSDAIEVNLAGQEGEGAEVEDVKVFEGPATYKCGHLSCPKGAFCEIKQKPDIAGKKVTITTQCRDAAGKVLVEETTTEDIPNGKIPFTSVSRKIVKGNSGGAYYGSSYAGSFKSGNIGVQDDDDENSIDSIDFKPLEDNDTDEGVGLFGSSLFDKIWVMPMKILDSTSKMLKDVFSK